MTDGPAAIRAERASDFARVESLVEAAFGNAGEAHLVKRLRTAPDAISLVAEEAGVARAHVLFTRVHVAGSKDAPPASGLAPLAVEPGRQRSGLGGALARAGLDACRARGDGLVFVLGHAAYYPRFGFVPAAPLGLHYGDGSHDASFFVCELRPGAARGVRGRVVFDPAFDGL